MAKAKGIGPITFSSVTPRESLALSNETIQGRLALSTLSLTAIVVGFYLYKSDNYGG